MPFSLQLEAGGKPDGLSEASADDNPSSSPGLSLLGSFMRSMLTEQVLRHRKNSNDQLSPLRQRDGRAVPPSAKGDFDLSRWIALPLVLLGVRTTLKDDLKSFYAELLYGESLRLPGEFVTAPNANGRVEDLTDFVTNYRQRMSKLRPVPASRQADPGCFTSAGDEWGFAHTSSHAFLRDDAVRKPLTPAYTGLHHILQLKTKTVVLDINGKNTGGKLGSGEACFALT
ncbi:unnamed protein product [Euphydryas editha]|uniref:Uncharacterized protein n=1 Tax=Euphydryas editha TaxID=104508 RepID=A0AAU9UIR4_EUPED|nr:unnamed protein product [Euphydryas editha]